MKIILILSLKKLQILKQKKHALFFWFPILLRIPSLTMNLVIFGWIFTNGTNFVAFFRMRVGQQKSDKRGNRKNLTKSDADIGQCQKWYFRNALHESGQSLRYGRRRWQGEQAACPSVRCPWAISHTTTRAFLEHTHVKGGRAGVSSVTAGPTSD
jgi:hypothetical protein